MIVFLALSGCGDGPPAVDEWKCTIRKDSQIAVDPDWGELPMRRPGSGQVLVLEASWGKMPFILDTEQYINFLVSLPTDLQSGGTFTAARRDGYLRIGTQGPPYYESHELDGTIHVVKVTPESAVLDLDLHARKPVIDQLEYGEKHIKGRVTATFKEGKGP